MLKSYGINAIPSFLWRYKYDDGPNLTKGTDKLHQRCLGFIKKIQKAMIADGSIFGGDNDKDLLNGYCGMLRMQGFPGLTRNCHIFTSADMTAHEHQTVQVCVASGFVPVTRLRAHTHARARGGWGGAWYLVSFEL